MKHSQQAIVRLPEGLQRRVRGQVTIASLHEALAEVVANSLDAGASEISVELQVQAAGGPSFRVQDNGSGIPAASLELLGAQFASSNLTMARSHHDGHGSVALLGYRGEALAAISSAAAVEVVSRATGSFETHAVLLRGGQVARQGLALEQRNRQGTVVSVFELFYNQPVRCKALLGRLQQEVDRCKEAVLRLALVRPHITFTLFERGRKVFLVRLLKGRSLQESVCDFLGQPLGNMVALQPVPGAAYALTGFAALPPHGHPNASRQCVYVNGRWVKAAPISKLVDAVFQAAYKPNMRLQQAQGEELQQVHKAANRHAAFLLQISCPPSEFELAHEAEGDLVHFRSWEPLLAEVWHALLAALRLVLPNTLLKELEQLETADAAVPELAAAQSMRASGHQAVQLLAPQQADTEAAGSVLPTGMRMIEPGSRQVQGAVAHDTAVPSAGIGGNLQRGSGSRRQLAGSKPSLASRLVRYNSALAAPAGPRSAPARAAVAPQAGSTGVEWHADDEPSCKRARADQLWRSPHSTPQQQLYGGDQLEAPMRLLTGGGGTSSSLVLASLLPGWQQQHHHHQQHQQQLQPQGQHHQHQESPVQPWRTWDQGVAEVAEGSPLGCAEELPFDPQGTAPGSGHEKMQQPSQLPLNSKEGAALLIDGCQPQNRWQQHKQQPWQHNEQEQEQEQHWQQWQQWPPWEQDEQQPWEQFEQQHNQRSWQQQQQQQQQQHEQESGQHQQLPPPDEQEKPGEWARSTWRLPLDSSDEADALIASWQPLTAFKQAVNQGWQLAEEVWPVARPGQQPWESSRWPAGCMQQLSWQHALLPSQQVQQTGHTDHGKERQQGSRRSRLTAEEMRLLHAVAEPHPQLPWQQRPQSAPLHPRRRPPARTAVQLAPPGRQDGCAVKPAEPAGGDPELLAGPQLPQQPMGECLDGAMQCQGSSRRVAKQQQDSRIPPSGSPTAAAWSAVSRAAAPGAALQAAAPAPEQPALAPKRRAAAPEQPAAASEQPAAVPEQPASAPEFPVSVPQQATAALERPPAAPERPASGAALPVTSAPATEQLMPDFLQRDTGLDVLLASWRQPAVRSVLGGGSGGVAPGDSSPNIGGILTLDAAAAAAFAQLKPATLTRQQLCTGRALRQVDCKFIPLVCEGGLLALCDQHAADERVQLERLRDHLLGADGHPRRVHSQELRTPLPLGLTDAEQQVLEAYQHKVATWGWQWQPISRSGSNSNSISCPVGPLLTHVPVLWGTSLTAADLKLYLHLLQDTCGACGLPAAVVRVMNSKACRSAIMFGDRLEQAQCQELVDSLKATQLCFSCAHGRPTTAPLVDLRLLKWVLQLRADAVLPGMGSGTSGHGRGTSGYGSGSGFDFTSTAAGTGAGLAGLKGRLQGYLT